MTNPTLPHGGAQLGAIDGPLVMIGMGSIGRATLPLLDRLWVWCSRVQSGSALRRQISGRECARRGANHSRVGVATHLPPIVQHGEAVQCDLPGPWRRASKSLLEGVVLALRNRGHFGGRLLGILLVKWPLCACAARFKATQGGNQREPGKKLARPHHPRPTHRSRPATAGACGRALQPAARFESLRQAAGVGDGREG